MSLSFYKIFVAFFAWNGILELLPPVLSAPSTGPLKRKIGEDVVFMFNVSTNILEVLWGIRDGNTNNLKQGSMIYVDSSGAQLNPNLPSRYAGRLSFVGDLTKGQAWFKIINLNINDTNQYMAKTRVQGASGYNNIPLNLTVIKPIPTTVIITIVPTTSKLLLTSTTTSRTVTSELPSTQSPKPTTTSSKNRSGSDSTCTCTSIIATCIAIIILLVLAVVFLLIYIWRGKATTKRRKMRTVSSIPKDEELGVYENAFQVGDTSVDKSTLKSSRMPTADKELYETVNEDKPHGKVSSPSGSRVSTANVTTSLDPFTNIQGNSPSMPQQYQELTNVSKRQSMPVYEPLNQRSNESKNVSSGEKTYEQLQQNPQGREYQSLESYPKVESKV